MAAAVQPMQMAPSTSNLWDVLSHKIDNFKEKDRDKDCEAAYNALDKVNSLVSKVAALIPSNPKRDIFMLLPASLRDRVRCMSISAREFFASDLVVNATTAVNAIWAAVMIPVTIWDLAEEVEDFADAVKERSVEFIADCTLNIGRYVGDLTLSGGVIITALHQLKLVGEAALRAVAPLSAVGVALGGLGAVKYSINFFQMRRMEHKFAALAAQDDADEAFALMRDLVDDDLRKSGCKKYLGKELAWLNAKLDLIEAKDADVKREAMQALSRRITRNKWSTGLQMLASTVSLVVSVVLLVGSGGVAFPYIGIALVVTSLAKMAFDFYARRSFRKALEHLADSPMPATGSRPPAPAA